MLEGLFYYVFIFNKEDAMIRVLFKNQEEPVNAEVKK